MSEQHRDQEPLTFLLHSKGCHCNLPGGLKLALGVQPKDIFQVSFNDKALTCAPVSSFKLITLLFL